MENNQEKLGILYSASAYFLWGFLPIFWKLGDDIPAGEILAHRIVWSFVFMIIIISILREWSPFIEQCKIIWRDRKKLVGITAASLFISLNWLTFIWAVNTEHVVQASLGYYINPLISILLGIIVLKESLTRRQLLSFVLAGAGVLYLTFSFGVFPWISLILAFSFGLYGLLKKIVEIPAMFGLTIETMIVTPVAAIYLLILSDGAFSINEPISPINIFLLASGTVTAVPLLLFASGAKLIPLAMVGFLQYLAPTIMLILGVFLYNETFTIAHLVAFLFIWSALIIYMGSAYKRLKHRQISK